MARELNRWLVALVIASATVLPSAGAVRAEAEKVARWQWVEDDLVVLDAELADLDQKAMLRSSEVEKARAYLEDAMALWQRYEEKSRTTQDKPWKRCADDVLVQSIENALACQWQEDVFAEQIRVAKQSLANYRDAMWLYHTAMSKFNVSDAEYFRRRADLQRRSYERTVADLRSDLSMWTRFRREELARLGLPAE